jgi:hypothetical protein
MELLEVRAVRTSRMYHTVSLSDKFALHETMRRYDAIGGRACGRELSVREPRR